MSSYAPGPKGHFPFGCFKSFRDTPLELLLSCQQQYGDVVKLPVGPGVSFCLVYAPDDLNKVFGDACFGRSDLAAEFEPLAGGSMIIADGDTWRSQRKAVVPSFAIRRLRQMAGQIDRLAAGVVAGWRDKIVANGAIDLQQECVSYAMQVLSEFLFGKQISKPQVDSIAHWWGVSLHHMNIRLSQPVPLPQWLPTRNTLRLNHAASNIGKTLLQIIEQHRGEPELANGGFLSDLLSYRDERTGDPLSQQHILKEIMGVFLAGFDTVASGMMWTFYYLAQHPQWQHALREEQQALVSIDPADFSRNDRPVLNMVYSEAIRLSPPLWLVDRKANADVELGGFAIPKGTNIITSPYVTHRDAKWWEKPLEFHPEHFSSEQAIKRPNYAYFPFGGGRMKCIGIHLAKLQLSSLAWHCFNQLELSVIDELPATIEPAFVLRTKTGLFVQGKAAYAQTAIAG